MTQLTTPQRLLLIDIRSGDTVITNRELKTAGALVEKGLCIWGEKRNLILTGAGMVIIAGTK